MQRHKARNSFKFSSEAQTLAGPLKDFYSKELLVKILYDNKTQEQQQWTARYAVSQLVIHEPTWLVLTLENSKDSAAAANNTFEEGEDTTANNSLQTPPSVRLQVTLDGPYRPEVRVTLSALQTWSALVDEVEAKCVSKVNTVSSSVRSATLSTMEQHKAAVILAATPFVAGALVLLPVVLGVGTLILPVVALPVILLVLVFGGLLAAVSLFLWSSTTHGRSTLQKTIGPAVQPVLKSSLGQQFVYETGPRPSPTMLTRELFVPNSPWMQLLVCLTIDGIGSGSYLLPFLGELTDLVWAPVQTVYLLALYDEITATRMGGSSNNLAPSSWARSIVQYGSLLEELLPFTDVLPSATLTWLLEYGGLIVTGKMPNQHSVASGKHKSGVIAVATATTNAAATPVL